MTTPAVNLNQTLTQPSGTWTYRLNGNNTFLATSPQPLAWVKRGRPASQSTEPNSYGFRQPTTWSHHGNRITYGTLTIEVLVPNPTNVYKNVYTGNSRVSTAKPEINSYDDTLWEKSINGALEKLKSQNVNLGVAFKERIKTANLIESTANRIARSVQKLKDLKRGKIWAQVKKTIPGLSQYPSEYLATSYGWTPLLADVDGSMRELAGLHERVEHPYYVKVSKMAKRKFTDLVPVEWCRVIPGLTSQHRLICLHEEEEGAYASFYYSLANYPLQKASSLGLTNPASIAWEVLPFSFVYDWMHPAGDWINLLDADFGWNYLGGSVSRWREIRQSGRNFESMPANASVVDGSASSIRRWAKNHNRNRFSDPPWPVFPALRNPFGSSGAPKRVSNAIALLAQKLR